MRPAPHLLPLVLLLLIPFGVRAAELPATESPTAEAAPAAMTAPATAPVAELAELRPAEAAESPESPGTPETPETSETSGAAGAPGTPGTPGTEDAAKDSAAKRWLSRLPKVSGYVQLGYEFGDELSSFFIKRVRLDLAGAIAPKLGYRIQLEFASPKIVDAYLEYKPLKQLNLKVGEYKIPFSIENTVYPPLKFELIEYPLALQRLMGFDDVCGLAATGRDMGATLYGDLIERDGRALLSYDLGVFNGEGINARDRNLSKDLAARLTLRPLRGLQIAASYYWGEYGTEYLRRVRYGAGICYDRGRIILRSEWIGGETGLPAPEGVRHGGLLESRGWYALGGWRATPTLTPLVRYDTFLENASSDATRQTNWTAGLLWQPVRFLRCQLNYTCEQYAARDTDPRNVVSLMFTGIF